jgi:L-threonylcarbamoyladenylate synthase
VNNLNAEDSANWLAENKILLHPTEGVWGIGCNAKSSMAVERIFDLKKRDKSKKFILLSPSIDSVREFCIVSKEDTKILENKWPGPITFILEKSSDKYQELSYLGRHAVRVSAHTPLIELLDFFGSEIVSTSANISGEKEIKNKDDIVNFFNYEDVAIFNKSLGNLKKPTKIFDLKLKKYIR